MITITITSDNTAEGKSVLAQMIGYMLHDQNIGHDIIILNKREGLPLMRRGLYQTRQKLSMPARIEIIDCDASCQKIHTKIKEITTKEKSRKKARR